MTIGKMKQGVLLKISEARVAKIRHSQDLTAQIVKLTAERDAIDAEIKLDMESHGASACTYRGRVIADWVVTNGSRRVDVKRLRAERPDVAEEFMKDYPS